MSVRTIVCCVVVGLFSAGCSDDPAPATDAGTVTDRGGGGTDTGARTDSGGGGGADAGPDPWACLGRVPPVMSMGTTVTIALAARHFSAGTPMVGLTVKACARADIMCATPQSMGTTDAMGNATLMGTAGANGFDGYIELTGGMGDNAVVPTRMFPNPALAGGMRTLNASVIPQATFALLGGILMAQLNATSGAITFGVGDCNRGPAEGASVAASPMPMGARQFYTVGGLPNTMATATSMSGSGGFVNVPPGDYTLTSTRVMGMARIGTVAVNVRGGYFTSVNVGPSP